MYRPGQAVTNTRESFGGMFVQVKVQNTSKMEIHMWDNGETTKWKAREHTNLLMATVTKVAGKPMREMALALSFGQVDKSMKDSGRLESEMAKVLWFSLVVISTLGNGKTVRERVKGSFTSLMARCNIAVLGKMINQLRSDKIFV